jgi:hypothetical protein
VKLDWLPDFQMVCRDSGRIRFDWPRYGAIESHVRHCEHVRLVAPGPDVPGQWLFQLRFPEGTPSGRVAVRVDVPPDRLAEAQDYMDMLHRYFGVPVRQEEPAAEAGLGRVPLGSAQWIAAPTGASSEELFEVVMARVDSDTG